MKNKQNKKSKRHDMHTFHADVYDQQQPAYHPQFQLCKPLNCTRDEMNVPLEDLIGNSLLVHRRA